MARIDTAVYTAPYGYFYLGEVGSVTPTQAEIQNFDPAVGLTGKEEWGHTSRDDLPEMDSDGGDTETKGSWQNEALRTIVTEPRIEFMTFNSIQWDIPSLERYYAQANPADAPAGTYVVDQPDGNLEGSLSLVIVDGDFRIGWHAPRVNFRRDDAPSFATDEFSALPIRATVLRNGSDPLQYWINVPGAATPAAVAA